MISPETAHEKIDEFARLGDNWDSYKAPATSPVAVAKAHEIVDLRPYLIQWVTPYPGGIQIDYAYHPYSIEVEIDADGSVDYNLSVTTTTCFDKVTTDELLNVIDFATGKDQRKRGYLASKQRAIDAGEDVSGWKSPHDEVNV
jgi:hypothetical protein